MANEFRLKDENGNWIPIAEKVPASASKLGLVKIGEGISIDEDGTISASGGDLVVVLTSEDDVNFVADKTFSEIKEAFPNVKVVFHRDTPYELDMVYKPVQLQNTPFAEWWVLFEYEMSSPYGIQYSTVKITESDEIEVDIAIYPPEPLATVDDLTEAIGGAINGSY